MVEGREYEGLDVVKKFIIACKKTFLEKRAIMLLKQRLNECMIK